MKRFQILDPSGRTPNTKHKTIKEVVHDLKSKNRDLEAQVYYVQDHIDDIEIVADDLIALWDDGERPEDLQMF